MTELLVPIFSSGSKMPSYQRPRETRFGVHFQAELPKSQKARSAISRLTVSSALSAGAGERKYLPSSDMWTLTRLKRISLNQMTMEQIITTKQPEHLAYMRLALEQAIKSPPRPTNFCVGALLVDEPNDKIISTGFTLELEGNTHAEQCCLQKLVDSSDNAGDLPNGTVLYTTMEPCSSRSAGNLPCVDRILDTRKGKKSGISVVYLGVLEPKTFVATNDGIEKLRAAGIDCMHVSGLEEEILKTATAGHGEKRQT